MGRRTWIKIYPDRWLYGTLREESPSTRGIWVDILVLAGDSYYGDDGIIKISNSIGYNDNQICDILQVTLEEWLEAKERLIKTDRITVKDNNIIIINNWKKYQSEYRRQKAYRRKFEENQVELQLEVTGRRENREERKENYTKNTYTIWLEEWKKFDYGIYVPTGEDWAHIKRIYEVVRPQLQSDKEFYELFRFKTRIMLKSYKYRTISMLAKSWNWIKENKEDPSWEI